MRWCVLLHFQLNIENNVVCEETVKYMWFYNMAMSKERVGVVAQAACPCSSVLGLLYDTSA